MKRTNHINRTNVSFRLEGFGNEGVAMFNSIIAIAQKHNAQINVYCNMPFHMIRDNNGIQIASEQRGSFGGAITFHAATCDHVAAADELLSHIGIKYKTFIEVIKTHREDGSKYKRPQCFIEEVK